MSTTTIDAVADGVYRIHTPIPPGLLPGGFSFNQYLVVDEDPLLFHTGSKRLFPSVSQAIGKVMPLSKLRYVSFSHHEQDEDGALDEFLAAAPRAVPVCGTIQAMINSDGMARAPKVLADGETLSLGDRVVQWIDAPHVPHGWESGFLFERTGRTLLCGDLFTQPGTGDAPVTENDVLGPSEALRKGMDYYARGPDLAPTLARLSALEPTLLACMHGSAWRGDGGRLLRELGRIVGAAR